MPDGTDGRPTWRDLNREINDLRDKVRAERRDNTALLRREIAKVDSKVDRAVEAAEHARDLWRKIAWSFGGGSAVFAFLVMLWTLVIQPLLALFGKQ